MPSVPHQLHVGIQACPGLGVRAWQHLAWRHLWPSAPPDIGSNLHGTNMLDLDVWLYKATLCSRVCWCTPLRRATLGTHFKG